MSTDKIDNHYQQQLSAWMDGDLPSDEARFLLRRLQHDDELASRLGRWQLCGDVLRGQAQAPAPAGFAERVAAAVNAEPSLLAASATAPRARSNLRVWGGGALAASVAAIAAEAVQPVVQASPARGSNRLAKWGGGALAASVAMVALFMVRQQVPDETPVPSTASVAGQSSAVATGNAGSALPGSSPRVLTEGNASVASAPRRQADSNQRRSATRTQQAASRSVASARLPERVVATAASAAVPVVHAIASAPSATSSQRDPFSNVQIGSPSARPWPRAVSPQYPSSSGGFNAGFSSDRAAQTFYPFEPRMAERLPVSPSGPSQPE